jgi:hypothetical protein
MPRKIPLLPIDKEELASTTHNLMKGVRRPVTQKNQMEGLRRWQEYLTAIGSERQADDPFTGTAAERALVTEYIVHSRRSGHSYCSVLYGRLQSLSQYVSFDRGRLNAA